jgi:D-aspartate ligase
VRHRFDAALPASPEKATMSIKATRSNLSPNAPGAIVLGGNFIGLGLVRSLGSRGIPTWVFDPTRSQSIAQFSKYTKRFVTSKEDIHELLLREGRQNHLNGWVVFPGNDEYVEVLSTHHRSLSAIYHLTVPPLEVTRFALDKRLTYRKADELGIATPWTLVIDDPDDPIASDLPYPVILKPAINHHFFPHTNLKALPAFTPDDFRRRYAQMSKYIPPEEILIQERIPGGGENQFSFCAVCKDGQAYASLVAQRRRQYPVDFGNASTFVETTSQPVIEADGRRFLESIGFDGMAEVEFKFDPRDGRYKILDVNPRPWGWHTLGKAAGIDFPYLLWQQKMGLDVSPVHSQDSASWLREITDLMAIAKSPHRKAEIKRLLRAIWSGTLTSATFDLFDPLPFFAEFGLWASRGFLRQKKAKAFLGA